MKHVVKWTSKEGEKNEKECDDHNSAVLFCKHLHSTIGQFKKPPGIHREDWEPSKRKKRRRK
jgi:hypothetical protein